MVLVNSNPATIMTDPDFADRTYIEPLTKEALTEIIRRERPVKKGKTTKVGNPTITQGKSLWCEDEMNKCLQATIVIEQK